MLDIIDEFEKLDLNFINEKVNLIRKFVKSKAEYWQQIPRLHLIYGRDDEKSFLILYDNCMAKLAGKVLLY